MKKRIKKSQKKSLETRKKNAWLGAAIVFLLVSAVFTGMNTSFYGVAVGILLGVAIAALTNQIKTK